LNRAHSEARRSFQIERTIIQEAALFGRFLRQFQSQPIDSFLWLPQADKARAYEQTEDVAQAEALNAIEI
jgi:hypothetical protein